jgi:outer membrane protein assembly factor BamE (lipoprotein component of BamABCDE complex)
MPYIGPADRFDIGKRAFRYISAKMSCDEVEKAFGAPFFTEQQGGHLLWVYRLGPSAFMLVVFSSEKEVVGLQERIYRDDSGEVATKEQLSPSELVDDKTADVAAWKATWKDYTIIDDRRGIGKKMETYIKVGMTKEEVEQLMGKPENVGPNGLMPVIWHYTLHTDSLISIDFEAEGKLSAVRD